MKKLSNMAQVGLLILVGVLVFLFVSRWAGEMKISVLPGIVIVASIFGLVVIWKKEEGEDRRHLTTLWLAVTIPLSGWLFEKEFSDKRALENRRREIRLEYLIKTFRSLHSISHRELWKVADKLESAVSDLQLFGTKRQVELTQKLVEDLKAGKEASLDPLLASLRDELRSELQVESYEGPIYWIEVKKGK